MSCFCSCSDLALDIIIIVLTIYEIFIYFLINASIGVEVPFESHSNSKYYLFEHVVIIMIFARNLELWKLVLDFKF